jgi:hypothetical protein
MLYERRLETRTRGLVGAPGTIASTAAVSTPICATRNGALALGEPRAAAAWRPFVRAWKVMACAREGGEILWQRPFATEAEALIVYLRLVGLDGGRVAPHALRLPSRWLDRELEYVIATVATFNASNSNSGADWLRGGDVCPAGVLKTDYLVVGGGGGAGGDPRAGGGGGGGLQSGTGHAVVQGSAYQITVGAGGSGTMWNPSGTQPVSGGNSVFDTITANGGGYGGDGGGGSFINGASGGCGGGGGGTGTSSVFGSGGTGSQGGNGGTGHGGDNANGNGAGAGGGGAGAAGTAASGILTAGSGGNGSASAITGSSVSYAGGGGGGAVSNGGTGTAGSGGSGGGGNGAVGTIGQAGGTNLGGGAGAGSASEATASAAGGAGAVILSFVLSFVTAPRRIIYRRA